MGVKFAKYSIENQIICFFSSLVEPFFILLYRIFESCYFNAELAAPNLPVCIISSYEFMFGFEFA